MIVCTSQVHNANTIVGHDSLTDAQRFMESIIGCCDALVLFDDGSTDGTREEIGSFGDRIEIQIISSKEKRKNLEWLGRARCLEHARRLEADWVLTLKLDEVLDVRAENGGLRAAMEFSEGTSLAFPRRHLWRTDKYFRVDGPWGFDYPTRAFRVSEDLRYDTAEASDYSAVPENLSDDTGLCSINIIHYGYSTKAGIERHLADYRAISSYKAPSMNEENVQFSLASPKMFKEDWPHGPSLSHIYPLQA